MPKPIKNKPFGEAPYADPPNPDDLNSDLQQDDDVAKQIAKDRSNDLDQRVREYLMQKAGYFGGDPNTAAQYRAKDPMNYYTKAAIDTAGTQGIAGGLAQAGTVFGMTPSTKPLNESTNKMTQALGENAQQINQANEIDPRVLQYLVRQQPINTKNWAESPKLDANGNVIFYDKNDPSQTKTGWKAMLPEKAPKDEKLPLETQEGVKETASEFTKLKNSYNNLNSGAEVFNKLVEKAKNGTNQDVKDAVSYGRLLLKEINTISTGKSDAVGAEEAKRLGAELEYHLGNFTSPGAVVGFDLPGFQRKLGSVLEKTHGAVQQLDKDITEYYNNAGQPRKTKPASIPKPNASNKPPEKFNWEAD